MNARFRHPLVARAIAGLSLAACLLGIPDSASAVSCTKPFPTTPTSPNRFCQQGNSTALVTHELRSLLPFGPVQFQLTVDFQGGTAGALAYGIDVTGAELRGCDRAVADRNSAVGQGTGISCRDYINQDGPFVIPTRSYDHGQNMASTFVIVA